MSTIERTNPADALRRRMKGEVYEPGDAGFDTSRIAYNLAVDQRPPLVALPVDEQDVAAIVRYADAHGLRVAAQRTGHNAGPLGDLSGTLLLRTDAMKGATIDVGRRHARVRAGAKWEDVVPVASDAGLAALHGSTPDVSIAGYSLGGGLGWYARKYGLSANSVTAIELVTADGTLRRVDDEHEPELFWALRGGGGNFGVVTALEFRLYPVRELYAGILFFPIERAKETWHAWHEWTARMPDEVTSVARVLNFPPLPEVPEPLRGNAFAMLEAFILAGEVEAVELLRPLRELGPVLDTFAIVPPKAIAEIHMDPPDPVPFYSGHQLVCELPDAAIDDLLDSLAIGAGSPLLMAELRHTRGALARHQPHHGALSTLPGSYALFTGGMATDAASVAAGTERLAEMYDVLAPFDAGRYLNFTEEPADVSQFFRRDTLRRLQRAKAEYDPHGLFHANHPIEPARA